ncbi:hypothetical protein [Aliivibrio sp. SR45-2]|uniref:hypothetical protein n=1 Tax=Aliivibrio sp. SR45-2 TaxID=2760931 RepID=UPI0015FE4742|nr:hypothetical protein [Aliivibrio sp. SR45-2]MBB1315943.1 hypothetical protein [Aliivibrio sp. SR45-2]
MSYVGSMEGDIYSHCWFYESARRSFEYEGYGDTCGGITGIALTAFMVESYLNLSCKLIFDWHTRSNKILDHPPKDLYELIDKVPKSSNIHERVAIAYGYKEQFYSLIKEFELTLNGRKKETFNKINKMKSFYEIDDKLRFSPKVKFKALSEMLYIDVEMKNEHQKLIERLFTLRNTLAHGRSEFVKRAVIIESENAESKFSSATIPSVKANWQIDCTSENAKVMFNEACNVIKLLSLLAFDNEYPFMMPTQIGAFSKG